MEQHNGNIKKIDTLLTMKDHCCHALRLCLCVCVCFQVMLLVYHWSSGEGEQHDLLISKPVTRWTTEEVLSWLENLGPWAQLYAEPFQRENVNGRQDISFIYLIKT